MRHSRAPKHIVMGSKSEKHWQEPEGKPRSVLCLGSLQHLDNEHYHRKEASHPNWQAPSRSLRLYCPTGFTRWYQSEQLPMFLETSVPKDCEQSIPTTGFSLLRDLLCTICSTRHRSDDPILVFLNKRGKKKNHPSF